MWGKKSTRQRQIERVDVKKKRTIKQCIASGQNCIFRWNMVKGCRGRAMEKDRINGRKMAKAQPEG